MAQKRGCDGLPVLHTGIHGGAKEIANEGLPHSRTPRLGTDGSTDPTPLLSDVQEPPITRLA